MNIKVFGNLYNQNLMNNKLKQYIIKYIILMILSDLNLFMN